MILMMICVPCIGSEKTVNRVNYGVIFRHVSQLDNSQQYWKHTFQIRLPVMPSQSRMTACHASRNTDVCNQMAEIVQSLNQIRSQGYDRVQTMIDKVYKLVPETDFPKNDKQRSSRSLLPFIGDLSKSLFGTARMSDLKILQDHMKAMSAQSNILFHDFQEHAHNMTSFMSTVDTRLSNAMKAIEINNQLFRSIRHFDIDLKDMIQKLSMQMQTLVVEQQHTLNIERRCDEILSGIHSMITHHLSPYIVQADILMTILQNVTNILRNKYPDFQILTSNPQYYYTERIIYGRHGNSLYATINIPLSTARNTFDVYEVFKFPIPINSTSDHVTILHDNPSYFAIETTNNVYMEITKQQYETCIGRDLRHCPIFWPRKLSSNPSCLMALFNDDTQNIQSQCQFQFVPNGIQTNVFELFPAHFVLTNASDIILSCPHKPLQSLAPCMFCIITLPCQCIMRVSDIHIPPRISNCIRNTDNCTLLHPINLALIRSFFDEYHIPHIRGNTTFHDPLLVDIPKFAIFQHNLSDIVQTDHKQHLDLKKMVDSAKTSQIVYKSLAEKLLHQSWIDTDTSTWSSFTESILPWLTLTTSAVAIILTIFLTYRMRKLTQAYTLLLTTKSVSAASTLPTSTTRYHLSWYSSQLPPALSEPSIHIDIESKWWIYGLTVMSFMMIMLLVILICLVRRRRVHKNVITLQLQNETQCIFINIKHYIVCPHAWTAYASATVDNISVRFHKYFYQLEMDWHDFIMVQANTINTMTLPAAVRLNIYKAYQVKKLLMSPFTVQIHITSDGSKQELKVLNRDHRQVESLYPKLEEI